MKNLQVKCFMALMAIVIMTGCAKEPEITAPHDVVVSYFNALYNERDFEKALSMASAHHQRLLKSYGTPSTVGRYLYNMNFDHAEIRAERPSGLTYMNNPDSLRINVAITGYNQGRRTDELFEVIVVFEEGRWKVDWKLDSPY